MVVVISSDTYRKCPFVTSTSGDVWNVDAVCAGWRGVHHHPQCEDEDEPLDLSRPRMVTCSEDEETEVDVTGSTSELLPTVCSSFKKNLLHRYKSSFGSTENSRSITSPCSDQSAASSDLESPVATPSTVCADVESSWCSSPPQYPLHLLPADGALPSRWFSYQDGRDDPPLYDAEFGSHSLDGDSEDFAGDAISCRLHTGYPCDCTEPVAAEPEFYRHHTVMPTAGKVLKVRHAATKRTRNVPPRELLWQFLLQLLGSPAHNPRYISWVDESRGIFRLNNTKAVSQLWGVRRNKPQMNYDTMGRALRYYYSNGILNRVHGQRLVYQFAQLPESIPSS